MKKIAFFASFIGIFLFWDLVLRVIAAFSYSAARRVIDRKDWRITDLLIAISRVYMGIRVRHRIRMPKDLPPVFLIISNHQSIIDIAFLYYYFKDYKIRFAAKHDLARGVPLVSMVFRLQNHAMIRRDGKIAATMKELERLALKSRDGICPVVFPEGTRSRTGEVLKFHAGAVRKILETVSLPVLTVAVDGGFRVARTEELTRNFVRMRYRVRTLKLFPPPRDKTETNALIRESESLVREQVAAWREQDGGDSSG
jgi:1-acyl-sn-glycerol-3-phosphate acyltransferase